MAVPRTLLAQYTGRLEAAGVDSPRLSAEVLLAAAMGIPREELVKRMLLSPETPLPADAARNAEIMIARREKGEPVAYITGRKEFYGRDFVVTPATLIPRPDTETLIEAALAFAQKRASHSPCRFLDMGAGSGAIAVTLALELPLWEGVAVDLSPAALDVAEQNAKRLGAANVTFALCDFLSPTLPGAPYDLIAANPPYVSESEYRTLSREVRDFEPRSALVPDTPDASGLECLLAIMDRGASLLKPGGMLFIEMGCTQGDALLRQAASSETPWENVRILPDLSGLPRVFAAKLPAGFHTAHANRH